MALDALKRIGLLTPLAALLLILVLLNVLLSFGNHSLRVDVNERQQFIAQSIQLAPLHREVVLTLAGVATRYNDAQLKTLLASQGISIAESPKPSGPPK